MKQILIPLHWINDNVYCDIVFNDFINDNTRDLKKSATYFTVLGIVNQFLANEANAKEIVSVEEHESFQGYYECEDKRILTFAEKVAEFGYPVKDGYLITYLESDMIASKDDLESAWKFVRNQSFLEETDSISDEYNYLTFNEWFEENFNNQS